MEPEPIRFLYKRLSRHCPLEMDRDDALLDPSSPTYVCFAAVAAFFQALLVPPRRGSRSTSPGSLQSPKSV